MISRPSKADLHTHSTASDGTLTPHQLIELAAHRGLTHLALTDHDSVEGLAEASDAGCELDVTIIPGVELSATAPTGADVHVLGYFIDPHDALFGTHLKILRRARLRRAEAMVVSLSGAGLNLELDDVLLQSDGGAVGRSHVARTLVAAGYADSVRDAFERFIGRDKPHYVAKDTQSPERAIAAIRDAGGIAVIAHPGVGDHRELVIALAGQGLTGVEAYHADHTADQRADYEELARSLGLIVTGGSDFHSPEGPNPPLGSVHLPPGTVEALLAAQPR